MARPRKNPVRIVQQSAYANTYDPTAGQPEPTWRAIRCARHHFESPCKCPPGPQVIALELDDYEICCGGGKGSVKTEGTYGFILKGNPRTNRCPRGGKSRHNPENCRWCKTDISYLNHPHYSFLVLRKNYDDLTDWFERAKRIFKPMGADFTSSPPKIAFPTGARGVLGHMDSEEAYEKYWGQEYARIIFDEIQQCPKKELYDKIELSCRSPHKELREQIMLNANPGGPGNQWIRDYFIGKKRRDFVGWTKQRLDGGTQKIIRGDDKQTKKIRVFVHSTVYDNPYYTTYTNGVRDPEADDYCRKLEGKSSDQERRQWLYGDFFCFEGSYYPELRERPNDDEPPWAYHVVPTTRVDDDPREVVTERSLEPWWPRGIGLDVGYTHPAGAVWGCWHPMGRLYAYREFEIAGMSSMQLGARIANLSINDLEGLPGRHLTIYVSHDAFWRKDESPMVEKIRAGIDSVLGRESAFVLFPNEYENSLPFAEAWESVQHRQQEKAERTHITIVRATPDRVGGWSVLRDLLRFERISPEPEKLDEDYAHKLALQSGIDAERAYRASVLNQEEEVVPKLRILDKCPQLLRSLESLVHDQAKPEDARKAAGDDLAEALRYLVIEFGFRHDEPPRGIAIQQRAEKLFQNMPGLSAQSRIMTMKHIELQYDKEHRAGRGVSLTTAAGRFRKMRRERVMAAA